MIFHWGEGSIRMRCPQIIFCKKNKNIYLNVIFLKEPNKHTTKQREIQPDRQKQMNSVRTKVFFFSKLCSWYYCFSMECCLCRQQVKGTFHSTCQAHATEATGSRQSFEEQWFFFCVVFVFVCSPLVPSITHYYTSYECHILHWLEDNQSFILCVISYVWAARQISFETTFCSETAFHSVLLEGLNRTSCVCVWVCALSARGMKSGSHRPHRSAHAISTPPDWQRATQSLA